MTRLGEFLQARRSQLAPVDVGLAPVGERRRVPGLRREELAHLAGVSPSYYARLEQGQSTGASPAVLTALADALRLGPDEREHLRRLAETPVRPPTTRSRPERVNEATVELLEAMADVPAMVLGRCNDVLAWNPPGHALVAGHLRPDGPGDPSTRPNMARLIFLDAHMRELYVDWPRKARATVGNLRLAVGRHPDDSRLAALIGELCMRSAEFAGVWADHRIRACDAAAYELRHPLVGSLTVTQQSLGLVHSPGQSLITMTAPAGSPSAHALRLLAQAQRQAGGALAGFSADSSRATEATFSSCRLGSEATRG